MTNPLNFKQRPLAFEERQFPWNLQHVPHTLPDGKTHPGRSCAIFVVHGIGQQHWTETAAQLRAGFEKAFEEIDAWQKKNPPHGGGVDQIKLPPPFIYDGYWANYDDIEATFPDDWKHFNERERKFFGELWRRRVVSGARTLFWIFRQQAGLVKFKVLREVGPFAWVLYLFLQVISSTALLYAWFRHREVILGFLNDLRLYINPRGVVECAIAQRIDYRVGREFLRMIGLDWEFRPLPSCELLEVGGERLCFERVVWVAHSLGTVISYNVLSALFHKAAALESTGDNKQKAGFARFRDSLSRFVTMGSPLDKVAFLFKEDSLHPWPSATPRRALLSSGEMLKRKLPAKKDPTKTEWWINFYHVFDPVSGALQNPFICGTQPPSNLHIGFRSGFLPGLAHVAYWKDPTTLRFILARTFGATYLRDQEYRPWSPTALTALAAMGYITWAAVLLVTLLGSVYALYRWGPYVLRWAGKAALKWITG